MSGGTVKSLFGQFGPSGDHPDDRDAEIIEMNAHNRGLVAGYAMANQAPPDDKKAYIFEKCANLPATWTPATGADRGQNRLRHRVCGETPIEFPAVTRAVIEVAPRHQWRQQPCDATGLRVYAGALLLDQGRSPGDGGLCRNVSVPTFSPRIPAATIPLTAFARRSIARRSVWPSSIFRAASCKPTIACARFSAAIAPVSSTEHSRS